MGWSDTSVADIHALLYKTICVTTTEDTAHQGRVVTIDPITYSIVLHNKKKLTHVFGHAVVKVTVLDDEVSEQSKQVLDAFVSPKEMKNHDKAEMKTRKEMLKKWITK